MPGDSEDTRAQEEEKSPSYEFMGQFTPGADDDNNKNILIHYLFTVVLVKLNIKSVAIQKENDEMEYFLTSVAAMARLLTRNTMDANKNNMVDFSEEYFHAPGDKKWFDIDNPKFTMLHRQKFVATIECMKKFCSHDAEMIFNNRMRIFQPFLDDHEIFNLIERHLNEPFCIADDRLVDLVDKGDKLFIETMDKSILFNCNTKSINAYAKYSPEIINGYDMDKPGNYFMIPSNHNLYGSYGHLRGRALFMKVRNMLQDNVLELWYDNMMEKLRKTDLDPENLKANLAPYQFKTFEQFKHFILSSSRRSGKYAKNKFF